MWISLGEKIKSKQNSYGTVCACALCSAPAILVIIIRNYIKNNNHDIKKKKNCNYYTLYVLNMGNTSRTLKQPKQQKYKKED